MLAAAHLEFDAYAQRVGRFLPHIGRTTDEVVEWIAKDAGLKLAMPRLAPWRYQLRRLEIGIRHIR